MKNIIVTEVPQGDGIAIPRYSVSYGTVKSESEQRKRGLAVIRALAGKSECVVEVYSELLTAAPSRREEISLEFRDALKKSRIAHEYVTFLTEATGSFLSKLLMFGRSNKITAHRVIAQFDERTWSKAAVTGALPFYGVKYYVLRKKTDAPKLIKTLLKPESCDDDIARLTRMIVFECSQYGMAGIFQCEESAAGLRSLLSSVSA